MAAEPSQTRTTGILPVPEHGLEGPPYEIRAAREDIGKSYCPAPPRLVPPQDGHSVELTEKEMLKNAEQSRNRYK